MLIVGINFLVMIINMRVSGMIYMRLFLFIWMIFVVLVLILFVFFLFMVGLVLMMLDWLFGINFFNLEFGGNMVIWEYLFWIFGYLEVYILILFVFGIFLEVIFVFVRKCLFGYLLMVFVIVFIGFLGFMVWVYYMFMIGFGLIVNVIFVVVIMVIVILIGIKIFNWFLMIWGGNVKYMIVMLYVVLFILFFVFGGVMGVMLVVVVVDY